MEQSVRGGEQILRTVAQTLRHDYSIAHTTIQVEVEGCEADEMYCTPQPVEPHFTRSDGRHATDAWR